MQQAKFGRLPKGERLERIKRSPNFRDGMFQNQSPTPRFTNGATFFSILKEFLFGDKSNLKPAAPIPSVKANLLNLAPTQNVLVWFGHSSYFMQVDGKTILVDPVLSGAASPLSFTTRAFEGSDAYTTDDLPEIDYLFMSHDHWDHADYNTLIKLKHKVKNIICGLGTGEHFEHWGFNPNIIHERDWNESLELAPGFTVNTVPARHFSGRGFLRDKVLWTAFALKTPSMNIFLGGDGGYDAHFARAGKTFGPFDLVILENGQYNKSWSNIHLHPEEVVQAAKDLNAKRLFPVHSSKFALSTHAWNEPLERITLLSRQAGMPLITPVIGELVDLRDTEKEFGEWWKG